MQYTRAGLDQLTKAGYAEIPELEFDDSIWNTIKTYRKKINGLLELYQDKTQDKLNYNIKYYADLTGNIVYVSKDKQKLGFSNDTER